jgi:hypothetical protein
MRYRVHVRFRISNASLWAALVLLKALFPVVVAADSGEEIRRAAIGFYTLYIKVRPRGIPREKEMVPLRPHLSKALDQNLREARRAEVQYQKANRAAVPPLIEGDLFTSLFEGANAFSVLSCEGQKTVASCAIEFSSIDPRAHSRFKWRDKVYLVFESGRWLVDDIEYLGNWEFMHKGRLKAVLTQAIQDSKS